MLTQEMGLTDFAAARGKPMSIPEWALWQRDGDDNGAVGDNPYFVDRVGDWVAANAANVVYHGYFNQVSGWTGEHRLASYGNAQARYKARFGPPVPGTDAVAPAVSLTSPRTRVIARG